MYVVSYPKSGRTWLRVLIGKALCLRYGLDGCQLLDTPRLTAAAGILRTRFSHDGFDLRFPHEQVPRPADPATFRGKRVVLLVRDARDVLVSSYFEVTRRSFVFEDDPVTFDGTLSEFIRSPTFGARRIARFNEAWKRGSGAAEQVLLVRYEQLHAAPRTCLRWILSFIGAGPVDDGLLAAAVRYASIENVRRLERRDAFADPRLRPGDPSDPDSWKVRRGVVGGYVDYLSADDLAYVERTLKETSTSPRA